MTPPEPRGSTAARISPALGRAVRLIDLLETATLQLRTRVGHATSHPDCRPALRDARDLAQFHLARAAALSAEHVTELEMCIRDLQHALAPLTIPSPDNSVHLIPTHCDDDDLGLLSFDRDAVWSRVQARWDQLSNSVLHRWSKLTTANLDAIAGQRDRLLEHLRLLYGHSEALLEREVDEFARVHQF